MTLCIGLACWAASWVRTARGRNYSYVDRLWPVLPAVYAWAIVCAPDQQQQQQQQQPPPPPPPPPPAGGASPPSGADRFGARLALMATLITLWSARLAYNYYRKGGYSSWAAEDYRWRVVKAAIAARGAVAWELFNLGFISLFQPLLLLWVSGAPMYAVYRARAAATGDGYWCSAQQHEQALVAAAPPPVPGHAAGDRVYRVVSWAGPVPFLPLDLAVRGVFDLPRPSVVATRATAWAAAWARSVWRAGSWAGLLSAADYAIAGLFLAALVGEAVADQQQWRVQARKRRAVGAAGGTCSLDTQTDFASAGLWRYSRHPNFFFEQAMWWILPLFAALSACEAAGSPAFDVAASAAGPPATAWLVVPLQALASWFGGALVLSGLFQLSTGLTERISASKYPLYAEYQRRTPSRLIPWFPYRAAAPLPAAAAAAAVGGSNDDGDCPDRTDGALPDAMNDATATHASSCIQDGYLPERAPNLCRSRYTR
ncbi:hypothetical protein EV182_002369 [Spiromyces aspiralis]|uniref:Uncharacterized protein n=1 Tax=Spiromyces aspiralis TaxID=68401 RepID=A0ACC1HY11_9FUNG|nr:hypothetical protein EV182_002369 [Spiromyces aspiralis]